MNFIAFNIPRPLAGSIFRGFVGIIYLYDGVHPPAPKGRDNFLFLLFFADVVALILIMSGRI